MQLLSVPQQSPSLVEGGLTHEESGPPVRSTMKVVVPPRQLRVSFIVDCPWDFAAKNTKATDAIKVGKALISFNSILIG